MPSTRTNGGRHMSSSRLRRRHSAPATPPVAEPVPVAEHHSKIVTASHIQARSPGWYVLWSHWRQTFTAFACFTPFPVVLDAKQPDELLAEMRRVELAHSDRVHATASFQGKG